MQRVVVTGIGLMSPLGIIGLGQDDRDIVLDKLLKGQSAITVDEEFKALGFASVYSAKVPGFDNWVETVLDRRKRRWTGKGRTLNLGLAAAITAVADAGVEDIIGNDPEIGAIFGTGGPSTLDQVEAGKVLGLERWQRKVGVTAVVPTMSSGLQAVICTELQIHGEGFSITSACATSAHCIGEAYLRIATGRQKMMIAGGADDCHATKACGFEAMGALYRGEDHPAEASSRPFDESRAGFIDAEGAGAVVLEDYEHAKARGAKIYAEIVGYGLSHDGKSMTDPSGEGAVRAIRQALGAAGDPRVNYVNAHGTSTPVGDKVETSVLHTVFGKTKPWLTSTKALTGHSLGGAGATESIYTMLMMNAGKIGAAGNLEEMDPEIAELGWENYIPRESMECDIEHALSNSFGFGGTNAVLLFAAA